MFGGVGIEDGLIELGIQDLGHQLGYQLFLAGFEDKVIVGSAGFFFHFGDGEELFYDEGLGGSILKLAIDDVYGIKFPVFRRL